jgi:hypothetical protein
MCDSKSDPLITFKPKNDDGSAPTTIKTLIDDSSSDQGKDEDKDDCCMISLQMESRDANDYENCFIDSDPILTAIEDKVEAQCRNHEKNRKKSHVCAKSARWCKTSRKPKSNGNAAKMAKNIFRTRFPALTTLQKCIVTNFNVPLNVDLFCDSMEAQINHDSL